MVSIINVAATNGVAIMGDWVGRVVKVYRGPSAEAPSSGQKIIIVFPLQ